MSIRSTRRLLTALLRVGHDVNRDRGNLDALILTVGQQTTFIPPRVLQ